MVKPTRKKTAPAALSFDFNKVARKAVQDHPELKKDILFVDASNDNRIASISTLNKLDDDDDAQDDLRQTIALARRLRTSFAQAIMIDNKKTIKALVFHPDRHPLFDQDNRIIDSIGTIDHELGHLLCPNADRTHGENVADAYAVLRHVQRFGDTPTNVGYAAWKRTMVFIMAGHTSHLTTFTIDRILVDQASANFVSLTPAQTIALARDYARKHTPSQKALSQLSDDFNAARSKRMNHTLFEQIAQITLAADARSDTFHLGARALLPALSGERLAMNGQTISLRGTQWAQLRVQLEKKITALPAQHPLRHLKK